METKNDGVLASLARTVGTTAGVIVVKTTQLKDEVVKMGNAAVSRSKKKQQKKTTKTTNKKASAKKAVSRVAAKKKRKITKTGRKGA